MHLASFPSLARSGASAPNFSPTVGYGFQPRPAAVRGYAPGSAKNIGLIRQTPPPLLPLPRRWQIGAHQTEFARERVGLMLD